MKNNIKNSNGITLVALVVTIIVLLILTSVGTYSGIRAAKLAELNRFTAELKIMQTQVNSMYEKWKNDETINNQTILSIGTEISSNNDVQTQANIVFTQNASGITSQVGYKYYSQSIISSLGIEGITQDFFVNIQTRSVVSYQGLDYKGTTYYTLNQLPSGLYNVEYNNENTTIDPEMDNVTVEKTDNSRWKLTVNDITYGGYVQKGKIQYQRLGDDYWSESKDNSFIVIEQGVYIIKIIDNAGNESDSLIKYIGDIDVDENKKITIPGVQEIITNNLITVEYKKQSEANWTSGLTHNYFTVSENGIYNVKFTKNSGETDEILVYVGNVNFNSGSATSWNFSISENNYKIKFKIDDRNSSWQTSANNIVQISEPGTYKFKVIDNNDNECDNEITQYAYVKSGLVLCYDGINNTGTGHSAVASTWADLSGSNNDGTLTSATWGTEKLVLDGIDDFVNAGNIGLTDNTSFSYEVTLKLAETQQMKVIMGQHTNGNGGSALGIDDSESNKLKFHLNTYGSHRINSTITLNDNKKHHIIATYNAVESKLYLYIDGSLNQSGVVSANLTYPNVDFCIGKWIGGNSQYFSGDIYNAKVYNKCLNNYEIKENYKIDKIRYNID